MTDPKNQALEDAIKALPEAKAYPKVEELVRAVAEAASQEAKKTAWGQLREVFKELVPGPLLLEVAGKLAPMGERGMAKSVTEHIEDALIESMREKVAEADRKFILHTLDDVARAKAIEAREDELRQVVEAAEHAKKEAHEEGEKLLAGLKFLEQIQAEATATPRTLANKSHAKFPPLVAEEKDAQRSVEKRQGGTEPEGLPQLDAFPNVELMPLQEKTDPEKITAHAAEVVRQLLKTIGPERFPLIALKVGDAGKAVAPFREKLGFVINAKGEAKTIVKDLLAYTDVKELKKQFAAEQTRDALAKLGVAFRPEEVSAEQQPVGAFAEAPASTVAAELSPAVMAAAPEKHDALKEIENAIAIYRRKMEEHVARYGEIYGKLQELDVEAMRGSYTEHLQSYLEKALEDQAYIDFLESERATGRSDLPLRSVNDVAMIRGAAKEAAWALMGRMPKPEELIPVIEQKAGEMMQEIRERTQETAGPESAAAMAEILQAMLAEANDATEPEAADDISTEPVEAAPEEKDPRREEAFGRLTAIEEALEKNFDLLLPGKNKAQGKKMLGGPKGQIGAALQKLQALAEEFAAGDSVLQDIVQAGRELKNPDPDIARGIAFKAVEKVREVIATPTEEEKRAAAEALLAGPLKDLEAKYPNLDAKPEYFAGATDEQRAEVPERVERTLNEIRAALETEERFQELLFVISGEGPTTVDFSDGKATVNIFEAEPARIAETVKHTFEDRAEAIDNLAGIKELIESSPFKAEHLAKFAARITEFEALLLKPPKGVSYKELDARLDALAAEVDDLEDQLQETPARIGERIDRLKAAYPQFTIDPLVRGFHPEDSRTRLSELEQLLPAVAEEVARQGIDLSIVGGGVLFVHENAEPAIRCHVQRSGKTTLYTPHELVVPFTPGDTGAIAEKLGKVYEKFIRITQDASFLYPGVRYEADLSELGNEIRLSTETTIEKERKEIDATMDILGLSKDDLASLDLNLVFTKTPPPPKKDKQGKPIPGNPDKDTLYLDLKNTSPESLAARIFEARKAKIMEVRLGRLREAYPNFRTEPEKPKPETLKASGVSAELLGKIEAMLRSLEEELGPRFGTLVRFTLELEGPSRRGRTPALELSGDPKQWSDIFIKETTAKIVAVAEAKERQLAALGEEYPNKKFHLNALNILDETLREEAEADIRMKMSDIASRIHNLGNLEVTFEDGAHVGFKGEALRVGFDGAPEAVAQRIRAAEKHSNLVFAAKEDAALLMGRYPELKIDLGFDDDMESKDLPTETFLPARLMVRVKDFIREFSKTWDPQKFAKFPLTIQAKGKDKKIEGDTDRYVVNIDLVTDIAGTAKELLEKIHKDIKEKKQKTEAEERRRKFSPAEIEYQDAEKEYLDAKKALAELRRYAPLQGFGLRGLGSKEKSFPEIEGLGEQYVTSYEERGQTRAEMWSALEADVKEWLGPMPPPPKGKPSAATILNTYFRAYAKYIEKHDALENSKKAEDGLPVSAKEKWENKAKEEKRAKEKARNEANEKLREKARITRAFEGMAALQTRYMPHASIDGEAFVKLDDKERVRALANAEALLRMLEKQMGKEFGGYYIVLLTEGRPVSVLENGEIRINIRAGTTEELADLLGEYLKPAKEPSMKIDVQRDRVRTDMIGNAMRRLERYGAHARVDRQALSKLPNAEQISFLRAAEQLSAALAAKLGDEMGGYDITYRAEGPAVRFRDDITESPAVRFRNAIMPNYKASSARYLEINPLSFSQDADLFEGLDAYRLMRQEGGYRPGMNMDARDLDRLDHTLRLSAAKRAKDAADAFQRVVGQVPAGVTVLFRTEGRPVVVEGEERERRIVMNVERGKPEELAKLAGELLREGRASSTRINVGEDRVSAEAAAARETRLEKGIKALQERYRSHAGIDVAALSRIEAEPERRQMFESASAILGTLEKRLGKEFEGWQILIRFDGPPLLFDRSKKSLTVNIVDTRGSETGEEQEDRGRKDTSAVRPETIAGRIVNGIRRGGSAGERR